MKSVKIFLSAVALFSVLAACQKPVPEPDPNIVLDQKELSFTQAAGSQTVTFLSTRDWAVKNLPDWVAAEPERGKASDSKQSVTIKVLENTGKDRNCSITFSIGLVKEYLTIKQAGPGGEDKPGDGTLDNPYKASEAVAVAKALDSGAETANKVYVKGFVKEFNTSKHEDGIKNYGNALFYITDDNTYKGDAFYCYQVYYLGRKKFTSVDQIKVGDEVIIYGKLTNYNGTAETVGKGEAYIYSLNGKTEGGGDEPDPGPDPVVDENTVYFNDFDKAAAQQEGKYWPYLNQTECWHNEQGTGISKLEYLIEGNKATVRNNSNSTGSGENNIFFGTAPAFFCVKNIALPQSANYTLSCLAIRSVYDAGSGESVFDHSQFKFYVSADGDKWVELEYHFENGDPDKAWDLLKSTFTLPSGTKTLCVGIPSPKEASTYRIDDFKLEISTAAGASIDFSKGVEISEFGGGETPPTPPGPGPDIQGDGTLDNPYTASEANILGAKLSDGDNTTLKDKYVKGIISTIKEINTSYGNATYYISADGTTTDQFYIYRGYSLGGNSFTSKDEIKVGDEVIVVGTIINYKGNTVEMAASSKIVSLNGKSGDDEPKQAIISVASSKSVSIGSTVNLNASVNSGAPLSYSSDNNSVATVSSTGVVTGVSEGTATITITAPAKDNYSDASATCTITVTEGGDTPAGSKFVKVTSDSQISAGKYLIVWDNGAHAEIGKTNPEATGDPKDLVKVSDVSINGDEIAYTTELDAATVTFIEAEGGFSIELPNGKYLSCNANANQAAALQNPYVFSKISVANGISGLDTQNNQRFLFKNSSNEIPNYRFYKAPSSSYAEKYTICTLYKYQE